MTTLTKTKLHQMGYRLSRSRKCYWKTRRGGPGRERKVTVCVKISDLGCYDVTAIEGTDVNWSQYLRGVRQLKQWEQFAFCL
jgi:hypothetical protein